MRVPEMTRNQAVQTPSQSITGRCLIGATPGSPFGEMNTDHLAGNPTAGELPAILRSIGAIAQPFPLGVPDLAHFGPDARKKARLRAGITASGCHKGVK